MAKTTIRDLNLKGKRVLVRVDYNVPLQEKDGVQVITNDKRIKETVPTIKYLIEQGARILLCAHLGRPKGKRDPKQSLAPVVPALSALIGVPVKFVDDCVGEKAEKAAAELKDGEVALLENLRYYNEEEANDDAFSQKLAKLADVYVNDAFGAAHRAHSSTAGVAKYVKDRGIGLLMERELKYLGEELENPRKPFVVILGGAKVSDKIKVIDRLLDKADTILIGGAMAYTFALAQGKKVGKSLSEPDKVDTAKAALEKAKAKGVKFLLPIDTFITENFDFKAKTISPGKYLPVGVDIPDGWEGIDIGPRDGEALRSGSRLGQDHPLERPHGRVRGARERGRHLRHRQGHRRQQRRGQHHRRRRLRLRHQEGRRNRQGLVRLDWWRRVARVPGRPGAARRGQHSG